MSLLAMVLMVMMTIWKNVVFQHKHVIVIDNQNFEGSMFFFPSHMVPDFQVVNPRKSRERERERFMAQILGE
jgi:hypothetical protein